MSQYEEISMQEAVGYSQDEREFVYRLVRVDSETTGREFYLSAGFVRIVRDERPVPTIGGEDLTFEKMLGEVPKASDPPPTKKRKTLDWGKIQALHQAGWSHAKIADEMGCTVSTVATGLSKLRKEKKDAGTIEKSPSESGHDTETGS